MTSVNVLAFPAPAETRDHVKSHPDVFKSDLSGQTVDFGYVAVKDDHGGDMEWDGRGEEGDIGKTDELVVDDDDVVRGDDG